MSQSQARANDVPADVPTPGHRQALSALLDAVTTGVDAVLPAVLLVAPLALLVLAVHAVAGTLGLLVVGFALAVGAVVSVPFVVTAVATALLA